MFGPGESAIIVECSANTTCTVVHAIFTSLLLFFILLTAFAYTTLLERRFLAALQARIGPNRAGPWGLLQPVADGIKLIFKEDVTPFEAEKVIFWLAPVIRTVPALLIVAVIPLGPKISIPWFDGKWYRVEQGLVDLNVGVLWLVAITSIGVYGVVLAGWASNNKYSMLGGLRSSAQMISYELSMGVALVVPILLAGSLSVGDIIDAQNEVPILGWYIFQNPLGAAILLIALLAEVNRAPFDLPEAEQELTAGYHTEYSGMKFAMFYMAEYISMVNVSLVGAAMYLGGYHFLFVDKLPLLGPLVFGIKVFLLLMGMIWVRATLPRIRYDRLMSLGWKVMLPLALVAVAWSAFAVLIGDAIGTGAYAILSIIAIVVLLIGAGRWLNGTGGTETPDRSAHVQLVSLPSGAGAAAAAIPSRAVSDEAAPLDPNRK
ncbi:NADH-quinone oxidoreductase subunit NuoH [Aggregatilinea lenta]|uniref:NADH-quinone oxidoreductase subunit NuoH n=1 Tax=Aggregatilinea lenta TaxID=913108 RepID=UPI000E5A9B1F|nr:NADH-quinone oxidoreductase subunit NuoH [Aggregatilinea lenta]